MTIFYSAFTGGFYDDEVHSPNMIPVDAYEITADEHQAMLHGQELGRRIVPNELGQPVLADPPPPTPEQTQKALETVVQAHLDAGARGLGYDSIATAVTYAEEAVLPRFQTEGRALRAWRSRVWAACYELLSAVQAGQRPVPNVAELIESLPALELAQ